MSLISLKTKEAPTPASSTGPQLLFLTSLAAEKVQEIREGDDEITDEMVIRVRVAGGGCAGFSYDLYFDEQSATDLAFDNNGVRLVIDEMSLMYLVGTEIDYVEGLQGAGFKFNNPNITSTCGCGSSFAM